jgi:hypothetical protein
LTEGSADLSNDLVRVLLHCAIGDQERRPPNFTKTVDAAPIAHERVRVAVRVVAVELDREPDVWIREIDTRDECTGRRGHGVLGFRRR